MLLLPAMHQARRPFRQALPQTSARLLAVLGARVSSGDGAIVEGGQFAHIIGDAKDKEAAELEKHIRTKYPKSINHSGILLVDIIDQMPEEEE